MRWLAIAALLSLTACDDDADTKPAETQAKKDTDKTAEKEPDAGKPQPAGETTAKLDERCVTLGNACGAQDKHKAKITEECKEAAKRQAEEGCTDEVLAVYSCVEKQICEPVKKVWVLADLWVLTTRHKKCLDEIKASQACIDKSD